MSRYINTEILCEAYTKFNIDIFDDKAKLEILKRSLEGFFAERAKFLFGEDVQVKIEFEKGSLKTKITVVGVAALAIAGAVGQYGSFRQGILQISDDAIMLSQSANLEMAFRTKTAYCDRLVMEKRPGVFGRMKNQLSLLDSIRDISSRNTIPITAHALDEYASAADRLIQWNETSVKLFSKFENPETKVCVASGFLEELEKFPEEAPWAAQLGTNNFRSKIADMDPAFSGNLSGAVARYKATLKSIKNNFIGIIKAHEAKKA